MIRIRIQPPLDRNKHPKLYKEFHDLVKWHLLEPTVYLVVDPDTGERDYEVVIDEYSQPLRRGVSCPFF